MDGAGNVYIADSGNNAIKELPRAFVDPTAKVGSRRAGSDVLPVVLPATANLLAPFAPTSDQPWLTITGITNGVVSFAFTANTAAPTARPISPCSAKPLPSPRAALHSSLGHHDLLEGPTAGSDSVVLAVTPQCSLDGHGERLLAAFERRPIKAARAARTWFSVSMPTGRDAHRHAHHRRPDAHRHPGRFNLCRGRTGDHAGVLGIELIPMAWRWTARAMSISPTPATTRSRSGRRPTTP